MAHTIKFYLTINHTDSNNLLATRWGVQSYLTISTSPEEELSSSTEGYRLVEYEVDGTDTSNAGLYTCVTNSEAQTTVKVFIEGKS